MHRMVSSRDEATAATVLSGDDGEPDLLEHHTVETETRGGKPEMVRLRRVPAEQGWRFVKHWVAVGKAEFPGVYRSAKTRDADRACVEIRLRTMMRARSVRDVDIGRYLPRVVVGVMLPSAAEAEAERLLASDAAARRAESAQPIKPGWLFRWVFTEPERP
jgi:hypothetical protein